MNDSITVYQLQPGGALRGRLRVPGDKSISHRSVMLGGLAQGLTEVRGFLTGEDCLATMHAFQAMGVSIERVGETGLRIHGVGRDGLRAPSTVLDLGNSGTSMRLMAGLMAGQSFDTVMTGDASLSKRPMRRIVDPLRHMGADIETTEAGTAPLRIHGGAHLRGIRYASPVASAQIKSGLLLAGLYADGITRVDEPGVSRDHTERMLRTFGVEIETGIGHAAVAGGQTLTGCAIDIPADISSAAFFMVGAAITPGSDLLLEQVGVNPTRDGIVTILRRMGADITLEAPRTLGDEPVADVRVRGSQLHGIEIGHDLVNLAIDEMPAVFVAAACATGITTVRDAAELRVKESDRIQAMCDALTILGIEAEPVADGARIRGGVIDGGCVASLGDHRVAMALAMAALRARASIEILDCANVNTSFPGFVVQSQRAGLQIGERSENRSRRPDRKKTSRP